MSGEAVNTKRPERQVLTTLLADTGHETPDSQYAAATGMDVSSLDYAPPAPMRALICGDVQASGAAAVGDIAIELVGEGQMIIPVSVAADAHLEILRGYLIAKVLTTGTTYTGTIFPIW